MSGYGYLKKSLKNKIHKATQDTFTIGRVVDTNDPQQMGRVRVVCPAYGDSPDLQIQQIPWAMSIQPLAGFTSYGTRGPEETQVEGPVAYGMWNVPKVGSYVLVGCVDGDTSYRFYVGGIFPQYLPHTMPHGRYLWNDTENGTPDGPVDTTEQPIEPLYSNITKHFSKQGSYYASGTPSDPKRNMEWRSRGADRQVAAINEVQTLHEEDGPGNDIADQIPGETIQIKQEDGTVKNITGVGYDRDHQEPNDNYTNTGGVNYDSHVYAWTTPGFHSFSMDDRHDNGRIRIRTSAGHQIIMDDTNERIYINTAGGDTWIELDQAGNIDIYASKDISTHAKGDINFTTDKTFRVAAKQGIHLRSEDEIRLHSKGHSYLKSDENLYIESGQQTHQTSGSTLYITVNDQIHTKASDTIYIKSQIETHIQPGMTPTSAQPAKESFFTGRVPDHEPWARTYSDPQYADNDLNNNFSPKPQNYNDPSIGRVDRDGNTIPRNKNWSR